MAHPSSKDEAMQELVSRPNRPNMTRIMELDESTRVNMVEFAVRGFPTTRGPENLRTVCEIAALSSEDPVFIGAMLGQVPHPEECLADWSLLAMRTDHEVMMEVLADRFGLNWRRAKVPSRWGRADGGPWPTTTFEQALIEHDAVRMFTTAVNRGWVDPTERHHPIEYFRDGWSKQKHPWLVHALAFKAAKIADQIMTYDEVARDPQHLAEALHHLSISRHEHDREYRPLVTTWWKRLLQHGADPWLLDEHSGLWGAPALEKATEEGATPGHRMLRHALNQLGDSRFRDEGREWLAMLSDSLTWDEAPVVNGQSLPAFALNHPKLGTREMWGGGQESMAMAERLLDEWARQGTSLAAASPNANPVELLLRPYLTGRKPAAPSSTWPSISMINQGKPPEPLLFDRAMDKLNPWRDAFPDGALDGAAIERLAQTVVTRMRLHRACIETMRFKSREVLEEERDQENAAWKDWVNLVHDRLKRLDRWVVSSVRPAWQAWTQDWFTTWSSWPSVPDDQVKEESLRRTERLALNAALLVTAGAPAEEMRPRPRL